MPTLIQVLQLVLAAGTLAFIVIKWRPKMNAQEQAEVTKLSAEIDRLNDSHEHYKSINASQAKEIEALTLENSALKAAAAAPVPDNTADIAAVTAKVDAELAKDAPPADAPPAA